MRWPWSPRVLEIRVTHVVQAPGLTNAIKALAAAHVEAAALARRPYEPKAKKTESPDPEWDAFLATSPPVDQLELQDLYFRRRVLLGLEKVDEDVRLRAITHYAAAVNAYGCPEIDGRFVPPVPMDRA